MKKAERNKWLKYQFMTTSKELIPYLPETKIMNNTSFWNMMERYRSVIAKPVKGSRGSGVIQITSLENNRYLLHFENVKTIIQGKQNTFKYLKRKIGSSSYVVQSVISRPTINGRPFDLRVIVQRKKTSAPWVVTAKIAKVAGKNYLVSNISRSKGTVLLVNNAFKKSSIKHLSTKTLQSEVNKVSLMTSKVLEKFFKGHNIYGLDIGLDDDGRVWVIEANLFPLMSHFLKMKDKTMYRRIMAYKNG